MIAMGWIEGPMPRLVSVQATGCAPVVRAFEARRRHRAVENAATVASGLRVPAPFAEALILRSIRESGARRSR